MADTNEKMIILLEAINFAAVKHKDQRRKDPLQTPFINHPIGVAHIITDEGKVTNSDILISAILHDTIEDTDTTLDEVENEFGINIRKIVDECTDDKDLTWQENRQRQIDKAPNSSYEAKVVKLADKLYNLRDIDRHVPCGWTETRAHDYFVWALEVVNGLRGSCQGIEDALDILFENRGILEHSNGITNEDIWSEIYLLSFYFVLFSSSPLHSC